MPPEEEGLGLEAETTQEQTTVPDGYVLVEVGDLPDGFKSDQALVASFKESHRKISQQGQLLSQREQELEQERETRQRLELQAEQWQAPQPQNTSIDQNPLVQYAQDKLMEGDIGPLLNLMADVSRGQATEVIGQQPKQEAPQTPQDFDALAFTAEQQVWQRHGQAYADLRDEVSQILEQSPELVKGPTFKDLEGGIDMAFRLAQRDQLLKDQAKHAQQEEERQKSREAKLAAQTATGAGPRPAPKSEQEQTWEAIKNAPKGGFSTA